MWEARGLTIIKHPDLWGARGLTIIKHPDLWEARGLTITKHPDLWEVRGFTIIKHPGEGSLKSYSKLLVVNSGNYYLDRLTAAVYEGNITYDVFNYINYINYNAIFIFNNVPNHEKMQFARTVRSVACAIFIFSTLFPPFKKFQKKICCEGYSTHVHVKYGCVHSRT